MMAGSLSPDAIDETRERDVEEEAEAKAAVDEHLYLQRVAAPASYVSTSPGRLACMESSRRQAHRPFLPSSRASRIGRSRSASPCPSLSHRRCASAINNPIRLLSRLAPIGSNQSRRCSARRAWHRKQGFATAPPQRPDRSGDAPCLLAVMECTCHRKLAPRFVACTTAPLIGCQCTRAAAPAASDSSGVASLWRGRCLR